MIKVEAQLRQRAIVPPPWVQQGVSLLWPGG